MQWITVHTIFFETAQKRLDYVEYLRREHLAYFSRILAATSEERESRLLMGEIRSMIR